MWQAMAAKMYARLLSSSILMPFQAWYNLRSTTGHRSQVELAFGSEDRVPCGDSSQRDARILPAIQHSAMNLQGNETTNSKLSQCVYGLLRTRLNEFGVQRRLGLCLLMRSGNLLKVRSRV